MLPIKEKNHKNTFANSRSNDMLSKSDVQTTFSYAIVGVTVIVVLWGVSYSFIKQINK